MGPTIISSGLTIIRAFYSIIESHVMSLSSLGSPEVAVSLSSQGGGRISTALMFCMSITNDGNSVAISDCLDQRPASSTVTFDVALEVNLGSAASQHPLSSPESAGSTVSMLPVSSLF